MPRGRPPKIEILAEDAIIKNNYVRIFEDEESIYTWKFEDNILTEVEIKDRNEEIKKHGKKN